MVAVCVHRLSDAVQKPQSRHADVGMLIHSQQAGLTADTSTYLYSLHQRRLLPDRRVHRPLSDRHSGRLHLIHCL